MSNASSAQIGAIQATAKALGMTEEERRNLIAAIAGGKRSCKQLTSVEAVQVFDRLKSIQGGAGGPAVRSAGELAGPYAAKLRALWLSGWHLGVVRDRTDKALLSFLTRQTGLEHTRFLRDAAAARRVIEALKSWLEREAGVDWPTTGDVVASKLAVYRAQLHLLARHGLPTGDLVPAAGVDVDAEIRAGGAVLRRALKAAEKRASNGR